MLKFQETQKETYQLIGFINIVRDILSLTFYLNNMKEYLCIKDFYIENKKFASKGDYITLLPDGLTAVNTNGNQKAVYLPTIKGDRSHFIPTFEVKNNDTVNMAVKVDDNRVNHPNHYNQGNIECIEAMISAFGKEKVMAFCQCNAFKYMWRSDEKNGVEDIDKANWYLNKYKELQNGN